MTKDEYLAWKASRGEPGTWNLDKCRAADELVEKTALANLEQSLAHIPYRTREFVLLMARCHYGSVEVDAYLTELNCYPEWAFT